MLQEYLTKIGLNDKESRIYEALCALGSQPASVLARRLSLDRVVTYKHLKKMAEQGLLKVSIRDSVQCFSVTGGEGIHAWLQEQLSGTQTLLEELPLIAKTIAGLKQNESRLPKLEIFEGKSGMQGFFRDMLYEAKQQGVLRIRMLASNTFDERLGNMPLSKFMGGFLSDAAKANVQIDILEASGAVLADHIRRVLPSGFNPDTLPASRGATNVFLVGAALYLASYEDVQLGLKIRQEGMSQIFHFFFDMLGRMADK